jgi:tetratricopeptide (TPR) repeat protein
LVLNTPVYLKWYVPLKIETVNKRCINLKLSFLFSQKPDSKSSPDENDFLDPALDQDNEDENIIPSNPLAAQTSFDLSNELDRFRHDWQRELNQTEKSENDNGESNPIGIRTSGKKPIVERGQLRSRGVPSTGAGPLGHLKEEGEPEPDLEYEQPRTIEDKAKYLFNKAVLLEQQGRHYDAIKFYRLSMQLDADIEFKVAVMKKPTNVDKAAKKLANMALSDEESVDDDDDKTPTHTSAKPDEESLTLCEVFQEALASQNRFCDKNMTQKVSSRL